MRTQLPNTATPREQGQVQDQDCTHQRPMTTHGVVAAAALQERGGWRHSDKAMTSAAKDCLHNISVLAVGVRRWRVNAPKADASQAKAKQASDAREEKEHSSGSCKGPAGVTPVREDDIARVNRAHGGRSARDLEEAQRWVPQRPHQVRSCGLQTRQEYRETTVGYATRRGPVHARVRPLAGPEHTPLSSSCNYARQTHVQMFAQAIHARKGEHAV